jgi:hypothetical protein
MSSSRSFFSEMETSSGAAAESSGRTRPNVNANRAHAVTATNTSGGAAHRCGSSTNRPMGGVTDRHLGVR